MSKKSTSPAAPEGARRATEGAAGDASSDRGRFSSRRKMEAVLRLLRGETLDAVSLELGVSGATLGQWRDQFVAGGQGSLRSRDADERDAEIQRLRAKVGEITMDNELLRERDLRPRLAGEDDDGDVVVGVLVGHRSSAGARARSSSR